MQELLYCATLASRKPKNTVWWAQTFQEQGQDCIPFCVQCAQKQEPEMVSGIGIFLVGASRLRENPGTPGFKNAPWTLIVSQCKKVQE